MRNKKSTYKNLELVFLEDHNGYVDVLIKCHQVEWEKYVSGKISTLEPLKRSYLICTEIRTQNFDFSIFVFSYPKNKIKLVDET